MDKIKSMVTGDAYNKPATTKDGAFTTQDADNAHTTKGTSQEGAGLEGKVDQELDNVANQHGVPKSANNEINQQVNKRI